MKPFIVSSLAALLVAVSTPATADTAAAAAGDAQASCAIAYVTGVGGSPRGLSEYLAARRPTTT